MGVVQLGVGFILFTAGSRHVPAADLMLIAILEAALAPILVWIFIAEVPMPFTLVGGVIVIAAVVAQAMIASRSQVAAVAKSGASP